MRPFFATLLVASAIPALATASVTVGHLRVVAWASSAPKTAVPPTDAVNGGIYCKAQAIKRLYAFVRFSGMRDKVSSSVTWFFNDKQVFVFRFRWEDGDAGRTAFNIYRTKGALEEGTYSVEVRSGSRLLGRGSVKLKFGSC